MLSLKELFSYSIHSSNVSQKAQRKRWQSPAGGGRGPQDRLKVTGTVQAGSISSCRGKHSRQEKPGRLPGRGSRY